VLDASAVLAWLQNELGADQVDARLIGSVICAVNWSEVVQRAEVREIGALGLRDELAELGLVVIPFDPQDAETAALLWSQTRHAGLSLADRACLALADRLNVPVLTTDRAWDKIDTGVEVVMIR